MNVLEELFSSLIITPEQHMRLRGHQAQYREQTRKEMEPCEERNDLPKKP